MEGFSSLKDFFWHTKASAGGKLREIFLPRGPSIDFFSISLFSSLTNRTVQCRQRSSEKMRETRIGSSRRVSLYINKALSETMQLSIDLILKLKMQTASRRARNEVKAIFVFLFFRVLVFVFFLTIDMPRRKRFFFCAISRLKDWGCRLETFFSSIVIQSFRKAKKEFYLQRHFDRFPFFVPCGDKCHPMRDVICV